MLTSFTEFMDFADRVRHEDPAIESTWLPPDPKLQLHATRLDTACQHISEQLAKGFRGLREDDFPMHYCAWGKARVGSTALTNLFGMAGFPSYYQPVKSMLRTAFANRLPAPWILPSVDQHAGIFSKETQGPYTLGESLANPLQILLDAGYPPSKLHLIILDRDPERSLASWLTRLTALQSPEILTQHYVIAALSANRVRSSARRVGIPITHYVYEASREPVITARALFTRLGLASTFSARAVTDWGAHGELDSADGHRIIYPPQPEIYDLPGLHGSDSGFCYRNGGTSIGQVQRHLLESTGVTQMYRDAVDACVRDLDLDSGTAARIFGRRRPAEPAPLRMVPPPPNLVAGINHR